MTIVENEMFLRESRRRSRAVEEESKKADDSKDKDHPDENNDRAKEQAAQ